MALMKVWCLMCVPLMGIGHGPLAVTAQAADAHFALPGRVTAENDPDTCRWGGMDALGRWQVGGHPVTVDAQRWLTQFPPGPCSALILPTAHWIEVTYAGHIVDGTASHPCLAGLPATTDLVIFEKDANQERSVIFLTDGGDRLFLLGEAYASRSTSVPDPNCSGMIKIGFDLADVNVPFAPRAVRVLSRSLGGGAPGFDLARVWARLDPLAAASCPGPLDGARDTVPDVNLVWAGGHDAVGHALYIGTDANAVSHAADPTIVLLQDEPLIYNPGRLRLGETYFWRVDALPDANDALPVTGPLWTFTTASAVTVDDFEIYDHNHPFEDAWIGNNNAHALAQVPPHPDRPGCQYMTIAFDNYGYEGAERPFILSQDWLAYPEVNELAIDFRGDPNNLPSTEMTVFVQGNIVPHPFIRYDGPREYLHDGQWHTWAIPLEQFNLSGRDHPGGVDFKEVYALGFMVDSKAPAQAPDLGYRLDFDNIRLRRSRTDAPGEPSLPDPEPPEPAADPMEPNVPRAWYTFDEAFYYQIIDSLWAFPGYWDGGESGSPLTYPPGMIGHAVQLVPVDGRIVLEAPLGVSAFEQGISFAFWQNGADSLYDTDTLCSSAPRFEHGGPVLGIALGCWERPGRAIWRCGQPDGLHNHLERKHGHLSEWMGRWNHWVFAKDFRTGRMRVYHNGRPWADKQGLPGTLPPIYELTFGNGWLNGHDGLLDELRIYDYALSEGEAVFLSETGANEP